MLTLAITICAFLLVTQFHLQGSNQSVLWVSDTFHKCICHNALVYQWILISSQTNYGESVLQGIFLLLVSLILAALIPGFCAFYSANIIFLLSIMVDGNITCTFWGVPPWSSG